MKMVKIKTFIPRCFLLICLSVTLFNCKKKNDITVNYFVTVVPKIDTLPCVVNIEYIFSAYGDNKFNQQINSDWFTTTKCHIDDYVTLKATGASNVKRVNVRIDSSHWGEVSDECNSDNCEVSIRKDFYK